jgi:putative ABC transport system permease protein
MRRFFLRLLAFFRPGRAEQELSREMESHLALLEDEFAARGMTPAEARVAARRAFGRPDEAKELHRASRSFAFLDRWGLDIRLALRLLVKYRGLSLAGAFAMAVAIALGAIAFEILTEFLDPKLPFARGNRVVAFWIDDLPPGNEDFRPFDEIITAGATLSTLEEIGAARSMFQNLVPRAGTPEPVLTAEVTPSAFSIAHARPLLGRPITLADTREGAAPVVVIGHDVWESRFGKTPAIIGETIRLGGAQHTIVGVMPEEFRFPSNHEFWTPLRLASPGSALPGGPPPQYFARLREDARAADAAAELTALVRGRLPGRAEGSKPVQITVARYTHTDVDLRDPRVGFFLRIGQLLIAALALVVAVNLAILFYARTVTRLGEIAVRTALGAGRARILGQLFLEALAVSLAGAAIGVGLTWLFLRALQARALTRGFPFWIEFGLSPSVVVYAIVLAVLAALVMGVLPGVKATGRGVASSLRDLGGRATSLGGVWTALVVAQVAIAVAILPGAVYATVMMVRVESVGPGFAAQRFVVASVFNGGEGEPVDRELVRTRHEELASRVARETGVESVSYLSAIPGTGGGIRVELEEGIATGETAVKTAALYGGSDFFAHYEAEIVAGRGFTAADQNADAVVVNRRFVSGLPIEGRSPLGLRFRYAAPEGQAAGKWYEIVGVVNDFPAFAPEPFSGPQATVYHAVPPGEMDPFLLSVRFERDLPPGITDRIRQIAAEVDPAMQIREVTPLASFYDDLRTLWRYLTWGVTGITASVLLLSAAGIYAMMSFVIARRTREIGIRAALGATRGRLLAAVFGRALWQLAIGVILGAGLSALAFAAVDLGFVRSAALLAVVAAIMLVVGGLAAFAPARRGLRLSPTEALRVD